MNFHVLDVGCGGDPQGDVNVDAFPHDRKQYFYEWQPKSVSNFVLADAHYLPFRNKTFEKIVCSHVLEHLTNPLVALKEMARVCNGIVEIYVPSQFCLDTSETHIFTWNPLTLKNLAKKVFNHVEVNYSSDIRLFGRSKIQKWLPFLNLLLSKLNIRPELQAYMKNLKKNEA